jgi:Predicted translation initiation factor 2B subunit, eIF-2B alpha/beta/delta family
MKIEGKEFRTIWFENNVVKIIDQTKLPHKFIIKELKLLKMQLMQLK